MSLCCIGVLRGELQPALELIKASSLLESPLQTEARAADFVLQWTEARRILTCFVRAQGLDEISQLADQLAAFARYGDIAALHGCIDRIAGCIDELWYCELPLPRNIL